MSAAAEEEAAPPPKKSIFACLTNIPGVCVPQKGAEPNADEPTPKSKSPTSVASKFAALSPYNRKRKQEEQAAKEHEETRLRDQFRRVDTDHSGKVDRHELKYLLNRVTGSTPTEDELDEMMDGVDTSGDGLIDFEEFRGIHQKAKSGELRFAELSRVLTEFDELVGLLDDDDGTVATEEQSTAKKPRLKSPMSLFSHKKDATTPKPKEKKSPMASMKSKFSFGKKKAHDEAEEVEESEAEEEPAGPSESLETREQASHKTPAKTPVKSPPLPARPSSTKKSPPLPPRPSSTKKADDVPAPVAVDEDAPVPAAPASTPDGPRKSGAMLDDESDSDEEAAPEDDDAGEAADRVGPLSPLTPAPEPTPQKTVEDDIAAESVTSFSP